MSHATVLYPTATLAARDPAQLAVLGFLARYREPTRSAYGYDLKAYTAWCWSHDLDLLRATRVDLELWLRCMEESTLSQATIARRFGTVKGMLHVAMLDGLIDRNPAEFVTRPPVDRERQHRAVLNPLEYAALLKAAQLAGSRDHALVAMLGMMGLRVSELISLDVASLHYQAGYDVVTFIGKGRKTATMPVPIPALRPLRASIGERQDGPIFTTRTGARMNRTAVQRVLVRLGKRAGITRPFSPHALRRTFATSGLLAGMPLRDIQLALRHTDPRTTQLYDQARHNLDRSAVFGVAAFLAGMTG